MTYTTLCRSELVEHRNEGEVTDDAVLVLQIVMEPQPLRREMFADHRHPQVRPVLAAIGFGRRETPVSRLVGTARRLLQQRLPLVTRQTLIVPVGAAMLAAMVEEDRKSVVWGKSVSVRVDLVGRRTIKKKNVLT